MFLKSLLTVSVALAMGAANANEFVIEKIGQVNQRQFQDIGIEYYRYVS